MTADLNLLVNGRQQTTKVSITLFDRLLDCVLKRCFKTQSQPLHTVVSVNLFLVRLSMVYAQIFGQKFISAYNFALLFTQDQRRIFFSFELNTYTVTSNLKNTRTITVDMMQPESLVHVLCAFGYSKL